MSLIKGPARKIIFLPPHGEARNQLVYRTTKDHGRKTGWEKRIVELGDGRSVDEIMRALYHEQLERGAGLVDVGTWKSFFDRSVVDTMGDLVDQGYLQLKPDGKSTGRNDMSTTPKRKRGRAKNGNSAPGRPAQMSNNNTAPLERTPHRWMPSAGVPATDPGFHSQQGRVPSGHGPDGVAVPNQAAPNPSSVAHRIFALVVKLVRRVLGGTNSGIETPQGPGGR